MNVSSSGTYNVLSMYFVMTGNEVTTHVPDVFFVVLFESLLLLFPLRLAWVCPERFFHHCEDAEDRRVRE